jgi:glycerol 3-phosphatase-2
VTPVDLVLYPLVIARLVTTDSSSPPATALVDRFDGYVIDLDGVVWIGAEAVPGAAETLNELHARGRRIAYLTNDPESARQDHGMRLRRLGIAVDNDDIITAASATASHIREHTKAQTVFVIGSSALKQELRTCGLELFDDAEAGASVDAVVVGGHPDFDYRELRIAALAVRRGAAFFSTGRDATFPMPDGPWPATGAILAAVETAAERRACSVGKPAAVMFELARSRLAGCEDLAVVGDNLESDIEGGRRAGLATILVLAGSTSAIDVARSRTQPDYVVPNLRALVEPAHRQLA